MEKPNFAKWLGFFFLATIISITTPAAFTQIYTSDLNYNGTVNLLDSSIVLNCFGVTLVDNPQCHCADTDENGRVDNTDANVVSNSFGQTGFFIGPNPCVTTANNPPVANAGPDQTVPMGTVVTLDASRSNDVDGNPLSLSWTIVAEPAGSGAILSDPKAMRPTFIANAAGSYNFQLIVTDGQGGMDTSEVTISTFNSSPVADAGTSQTISLGHTVQLDGSHSSDVDGNPLTYAWAFTSMPPDSKTVLVNPRSVFPTFVLDATGTYMVQLIVNDGLSNSSPATVRITTNNSAPLAHAGPDQTVSLGDQVYLDGSRSTDVDEDMLTFSWTVASRPSGSTATLSAPNTMSPTFNLDLPGTYVAQLLVSDGILNGALDTVVISTDNSSPVADAGPDQTVSLGSTVQLDGNHSSDVDGDSLTYAWAFTNIPANSAAMLSDQTAVAPSFVADMPGIYISQLLVTDGTFHDEPNVVVIRVPEQATDTELASEPSLLNGNMTNESTSATNQLTQALATAGGGSGVFLQSTGPDGLVSVEAEHFHLNTPNGGHSWNSVIDSQASGGEALEAVPDSGTNHDTNFAANSPRLDYYIQFVNSGTHYVWVHGKGPKNPSKSVHVGLNGLELATSDRISGFKKKWQWSQNTLDGPMATLDVPTVGLYALNLWMREDGFEVDKIVLTPSEGYRPIGQGPVESLQGAPPIPPSITTAPINMSVAEPAPAIFTVVASGDTPLNYQWRRNGVLIGGATGSSYTLDPTSLADSGALFDVVVSNSIGSVTSPAATLTILAPPNVIVAPMDMSVAEPAPAIFTVVASGDTPLNYQWRRNGVLIGGATGSSYTLDPTSLADSGALFDVVVSNSIGSVTSPAATLTVTMFGISTVLESSPGSGDISDTWLPQVGAGNSTVTLTATVTEGGTPANLSGEDTLSIQVLSVTSEPGQYTNHAAQDIAYDSLADISSPDCPNGLEDLTTIPCIKTSTTNGVPFTMTALDYGASTTLELTATVGGQSVGPITVTLPKDTDGDQLPDEYERQIGFDPNVALSEDADLHDAEDDGLGNAVGDGLSTRQEYRGFIWGPPLNRVEPEDSNGLYVTPAYIPHTTAPTHFRTSPYERDLFLAVSGYDFGNFDSSIILEDNGDGSNLMSWGLNGSTGEVELTAGPSTVVRDCSCPFALGAAFDNAGIAIHAMNLMDPNNDGITGGSSPFLNSFELYAPRSPNIDIAFMFNESHETYNNADGAINHTGRRSWSWDTKGVALVGNALAYGGYGTTFQRPLDHYFADTPYIDDAVFGTSNQLDPVGPWVEDKNDNGRLDIDEDILVLNEKLDGDRWLHVPPDGTRSDPFAVPQPATVDAYIEVEPGTSLQTILSPFDVNNNGLVIFSNAPEIEYSKPHCIKHTLTHELGHIVGINHNGSPNALMYSQSPNWIRDEFFAADPLVELQYIRIHNGNQ